MKQRQDILVDDSWELQIKDGDLVVGPSDAQHGELLLLTNPGEWKQHPLTGVGISRYLKAPGTQVTQFVTEAKKQLQADGYRVNELTVDSNLRDFDLQISLR